MLEKYIGTVFLYIKVWDILGKLGRFSVWPGCGGIVVFPTFPEDQKPLRLEHERVTIAYLTSSKRRSLDRLGLSSTSTSPAANNSEAKSRPLAWVGRLDFTGLSTKRLA